MRVIREEDLLVAFVKRTLQIYARSSFTKKGPGVTANLREALLLLNQPQRRVAKAKGWDRGLLKKKSDGTLAVARV